MSLYNKSGRLSVTSFSKVSALEHLGKIQRPLSSLAGSVSSYKSDVTSNSSGIDQGEPCFITKAILYTHEWMHWISAEGRNQEDFEAHVRDLRICDQNFKLDDPTNMVNLDCFIHKSLELYAFIAVTGTRQTLEELRDLLQADCDSRQQIFDERGQNPGRQFKLTEPAFLNAQYELVVLHPEHFLPAGAFLTIFDRPSGTYKLYVPAADRRLRESPGDITCPPPPPFSAPQREPFEQLNPFFVIINAEIRFRRYFRQAELEPLDNPLPDDVLNLMRLTSQVVDLIYWKPTITPGTSGERAVQARLAAQRKNPPRVKTLTAASVEESDLEMSNTTDIGDTDTLLAIQGQSPRMVLKNPWPEEADLKSCVDMGLALLSADDCEYDSDDELDLEEIYGSWSSLGDS